MKASFLMRRGFVKNRMDNRQTIKEGVSVFTPTYNRAYTLSVLYESLKKQTNREFEWIVVDDGSTDDTKELIKRFMQEGELDIKYYYQENSGKHAAHNLGVKKAQRELFTCVDSDDYLADEAIQRVLDLNYEIEDCIGMVFARGYSESLPITKWNREKMKATLYDAYKKYGLKGDTMLVFKTGIIKKVSFCVFDDEKFVPESYLYDQLDGFGQLLITNEILYICKYLPDGYTASMRKTICRSPRGYEAYIKQRMVIDKTIWSLYLDSIRYVAIKYVLKDKNLLTGSTHRFLMLLAYLPGWIFYKSNYSKYLEWD